eukprot:2233998-Rhodomonas_salina.4
MSGTDSAYAPTRATHPPLGSRYQATAEVLSVGERGHVAAAGPRAPSAPGGPRYRLRAWYAVSGTHLAYAATAVCLRTWYPISGTDPAYIDTANARHKRCPVLTSRMLLPGPRGFCLAGPCAYSNPKSVPGPNPESVPGR